MLVQNSVYRNTYLTDGVNKDFYFSFPILEASQVLVQTSAVTDTETVTTVDPGQYTVTGVGQATGGHISFTTAPPTGSRLALTLNMPITQLYQYAELDSFPAKSHEDALAKLTLICQQLKEQISRAVKMSVNSQEKPEDVVQNIYGARDSAAVSASAASDKAAAAAVSADAAHNSALAAALSTAAFTPATTTARGIGRVATLADMEPGAAVENGPAFLDVKGGVITTTPTAHAVPQAGADGTLNNWLGGVYDYIDNALQPPSMTGSATLNGTTNNTVQLTGIVTTLGLEVGDVIRIQYSGYNKLHTVESITNNNLICVNYEHAGNRGDGPLKLANQTASVTVTRIAKWYNAPSGLGQAWVIVTRSNNTTYTSPYPRGVLAHLDSTGTSAEWVVDGVKLVDAGATSYGATFLYLHSYKTGDIQQITELR